MKKNRLLLLVIVLLTLMLSGCANEDVINEDKPKIYNTGITVVGEKTVIPANVEIGKNCVIFGETTEADYAEGKLPSGKSAVKEGVE